MWPINYDNFKKFHISIGVGLMFAGLLLFITTQWNFYNNISDLEDPIEQLEETEQTRHHILKAILEDHVRASRQLIYGGLLVFLLGYIPWLWEILRLKRKK